MKTSFLLVSSLLALGRFAIGCGDSNTIIHVHGDGGTAELDGGTAADSGGQTDDGGPVADAGPPPDAGPPWNGGPLTCTTPGTYTNNYGGCGSERWLVKTGSDSQAGSIALTPTATTITLLSALNGGKPYSNPPSSGRIAPTETKLVFLRDVTIVLARLESDSDYHLGIQDPTFHTMIAEIPYPGGNGKCLDPGNPWACLMSRARAAADLTLMPTASGRNPSAIATIVGVPFYDFPHGQTDEAPNGIELHPVLAICFGKGCTPM
ncbi:MAG: hypothetical protein ABIP89_20140 [Polyangiaceae bacterium]